MLPTKVYKKRQIIYNEGDPAREIYIIMSGLIKIVKNIKKNPTDVAILGKSSILGEVAMFRGDRHSATAVVEDDAEIAIINKESVDEQLKEVPKWIQTLIRSLCDRLHDSNERISMLEKAESAEKLKVLKKDKQDVKEEEA